MFVNGMGVGSMVPGVVATSFRRFGGVCPAAFWALGMGINTGHGSSRIRLDNVRGVAFQHPFSDLMS